MSINQANGEWSQRQYYKFLHVPALKDLSLKDLLIKVAVASLCHTDFMVREGLIGTTPPCTGSHKGSGTVVATRPSVKDFKIGDRAMAGVLYHVCGACGDCLGPDNYTQYCQRSGGSLGVTTHGYFAEHARVDATQTAKKPGRVSFETAIPLACTGYTVWQSILRGWTQEGRVDRARRQWSWSGAFGHVFRDGGWLELTKKAGADIVVDARMGDEKVVDEVKNVTNGWAIATACAVTKMYGHVIQLAQPDEVVTPFRELARQVLRVVDKHRISIDTNPFNGLNEIGKLTDLVQSDRMKAKGIIIMDPKQVKKERESGLEMV
ncbi:GroES-like protein [Zopfia rhizophila CBS 207.26]|uniref:GroES-like protein n=1 Tax=Zopfia rhizophila CBS 207.26 TaxID=1314779 RepID=A0A6A6DAU9_9PEZI|nr:GroES-like protein [Zopfia rhizophila CBS 207.26]